MIHPKYLSKHDWIQAEILSACDILGIEAAREFRGKGWRADVFVPNNGRPIAFEVQLSPQSLKKTLERQAKFERDGIIGCWLFENPVSKLNNERPDLPLFYVENDNYTSLLVNLGDRRKVELHMFLENFISNNIRFNSVAKTHTKQLVNLVFYDMPCWKCGEMNQLYYVDSLFSSSCNAKIRPKEMMWESNSTEYRQEIVELASKFIENRKDLNLKLGQIKKRYSNTIEDSYTSFGCYNCDSLFGDWFVMKAKLELKYEPKELTCQGEIDLGESVELDIPHWCFPNNGQFCEKEIKTVANKA